MFYYDPSQEPPSERVILIQAARSPYGGEFGSVTAKIIRRAMKDDTTGERTRYFDGKDATGFRSATWSGNHKGALYVEDLQVHAQFDIAPGNVSPPYGEKLIYADVHRVEPHEAELMHTTFKKLQKKLDEQEKSYGYVQNVSDLILRFANAFGIRTFVSLKPGNRSLDYPANEFSAAYVGDKVAALVKEVRA